MGNITPEQQAIIDQARKDISNIAKDLNSLGLTKEDYQKQFNAEFNEVISKILLGDTRGVTVVYSGKYDGYSSDDIAQGFARSAPREIRIINNSNYAKVLDDENIKAMYINKTTKIKFCLIQRSFFYMLLLIMFLSQKAISGDSSYFIYPLKFPKNELQEKADIILKRMNKDDVDICEFVYYLVSENILYEEESSIFPIPYKEYYKIKKNQIDTGINDIYDDLYFDKKRKSKKIDIHSVIDEIPNYYHEASYKIDLDSDDVEELIVSRVVGSAQCPIFDILSFKNDNTISLIYQSYRIGSDETDACGDEIRYIVFDNKIYLLLENLLEDKLYKKIDVWQIKNEYKEMQKLCELKQSWSLHKIIN